MKTTEEKPSKVLVTILTVKLIAGMTINSTKNLLKKGGKK
jgi:hypothetical protein